MIILPKPDTADYNEYRRMIKLHSSVEFELRCAFRSAFKTSLSGLKPLLSGVLGEAPSYEQSDWWSPIYSGRYEGMRRGLLELRKLVRTDPLFFLSLGLRVFSGSMGSLVKPKGSSEYRFLSAYALKNYMRFSMTFNLLYPWFKSRSGEIIFSGNRYFMMSSQNSLKAVEIATIRSRSHGWGMFYNEGDPIMGSLILKGV